MGFVIVYFVFCFYYMLMCDGVGWVWGLCSDVWVFWVGVGCLGYVGEWRNIGDMVNKWYDGVLVVGLV